MDWMGNVGPERYESLAVRQGPNSSIEKKSTFGNHQPRSTAVI